jgi:mercuric ion transport protein
MDDRKLIGTGIVGAAIAAVCCFTPALVLLAAAIGVSAWLAWADYVVMPALVMFVAITIYALYRRRRRANFDR